MALRLSEAQLNRLAAGKPLKLVTPEKKPAPKDTRPFGERYKSEAERLFATGLNSGWLQFIYWLAQKDDMGYVLSKNGGIAYEKYVLLLPGNRYTPDFRLKLHRHLDCPRIGSQWVPYEPDVWIEVKPAPITNKAGKKVRPNAESYRRSRSMLRAAAELFPNARFFQCEWSKEAGWRFEELR